MLRPHHYCNRLGYGNPIGGYGRWIDDGLVTRQGIDRHLNLYLFKNIDFRNGHGYIVAEGSRVPLK